MSDDEVTLIREHYGQDGTFGQLYYHDVSIACTCELPWKQNEPDVSCIPNGRYWVEPYSSEAHPNVWHVTNVPGRSAILIHSGNFETDSLGCIVCGDGFGMIGGQDAVMNSQETIAALRNILPEDGFWLTIRDETTS